MKRIEWLAQSYGDKLLASAQQRKEAGQGTTVDNVLSRFVESDPTKNLRFSRWLIETYLRRGFKMEDLSKARETLALFLKCQSKLAGYDRDIGGYRTLAALWKAIKGLQEAEQIDESDTGKARKRLERARAHKESLILFKDNEFTVAVPLTLFAAKWWGRGTRWCTASDNDNQFDSYSEAPLFVIVCKRGKFQAHANQEGVLLMDADDAEVDEDTTAYLKEKLPSLMNWLGLRGGNFGYVEPELQTAEFLAECVKNGTADFSNVPEEFLDGPMCIELVKLEDDLALVPSRFRTEELYLAAIQSRPTGIKQVPKQFATSELWAQAITKYGGLFKDVPERLRSLNMLEISLQTWGFNLNQIPMEKRTREHCETAIKSRCLNASDIPEEYWDRSLVELAVAYDPAELKFVADKMPHYMGEELFALAVSSQGHSIQYIPEHALTRDLCLKAVRSSPWSVEFIPCRFRDPEVLGRAMIKSNYPACTWLDEDEVAQGREWLAKQRLRTYKPRAVTSPDVSNETSGSIVAWASDLDTMKSVRAIFEPHKVAAA